MGLQAFVLCAHSVRYFCPTQAYIYTQNIVLVVAGGHGSAGLRPLCTFGTFIKIMALFMSSKRRHSSFLCVYTLNKEKYSTAGASDTLTHMAVRRIHRHSIYIYIYIYILLALPTDTHTHMAVRRIHRHSIQHQVPPQMSFSHSPRSMGLP
jgi:hypothetical protein